MTGELERYEGPATIEKVASLCRRLELAVLLVTAPLVEDERGVTSGGVELGEQADSFCHVAGGAGGEGLLGARIIAIGRARTAPLPESQISDDKN